MTLETSVATHNRYESCLDLSDPQEKDILIEDIAHSLSRLPRFNGHTHCTYSVAAHSLVVMNMVHQQYAGTEGYSRKLDLAAMLHDGAETYIGDIIKPVKVMFPQLHELDESIRKVIFRKFDLPEELPPEVIKMDNLLLKYELDHHFSFGTARAKKDNGIDLRQASDQEKIFAAFIRAEIERYEDLSERRLKEYFIRNFERLIHQIKYEKYTLLKKG